MHFSLSFLSLLPLTMALQTIYLAVDTSSGQQYVSSSVLFPLLINRDLPPLKTRLRKPDPTAVILVTK